MTTEQILNTVNRTKTWRIKELLRLGHTRIEVANLLNCNYGFVHNVYKSIYPERIRQTRRIAEVIDDAEWALTSFEFNHTFGVEIEAYGIKREDLIEDLRAAGIEIESESYNHQSRSHWKIVGDSSVSGENSFELVSPKLTGEAGLRELKTVCIILKGIETKVNRSCGLHIHLDAENFNLQTWKNLYLNYAKLEPQIDSFMPNSRRENSNYYLKSNRIDNYERKINDVNNVQSVENGLRMIQSKFGRDDRYYKLNSQSYWRHRSVEFRQHSGTVDFKKISNWIMFLSRLVEFSKNAVVSDSNWSSFQRFLPDELIRYFQERANQLASN